jgi:hypothetical protein
VSKIVKKTTLSFICTASVGTQPGVDVMITIFCDFCQFSAKKLAFFSKTYVMINCFSKFGFVLSHKRQFFANCFRRKYLKNHNIGPRSKQCTNCQIIRGGDPCGSAVHGVITKIVLKIRRSSLTQATFQDRKISAVVLAIIFLGV